MSESNANSIMAGAQAALARSRGGAVSSRGGFNDKVVRGAALGATASLPFVGIGLIGGAVIGAAAAALGELSKD